MLTKSVTGMSAQKLRMLLYVSIIAMLVLAGVGFSFAYQTLVSYANDVRKTTTTADSSVKNLKTLESLKTQLAADQDGVERTKNIVADSSLYGYQEKIVKDINIYAERSHIAIAGYAFSTDAGKSGTTGAAASVAPVATLPGTPKTTSVAVTLQPPTGYGNIMNFIHSLEQNLTKMQLAGVSMTRDKKAGADGVNVSALTLEIYIR